MDDQSLHRYSITQIDEYKFQLEDAISKQTWEIEILKENHAEFIEKLKKMDLPNIQIEK